ncbi:MAG: hypothetical protein RMM06_08980 [Armatimonadota bacterium]|nr:hypothetical protein [bacterium]MDW8104844.1 hypothetical protein [Armatimonadota bacterium]MDW8290845.1 hypothetical protein [Armatimonadota bacterium]
MRWLLCRWVEYYLALGEDDIERQLPAWVCRHLQVCAHCQQQQRVYRRTREAVREYARLLPQAPPAGWRPLEVRVGTSSRPVAWQRIAATVSIAAVVLLGFLLWQKGSLTVHEEDVPARVAQDAVTTTQPEARQPEKKPVAATTPARAKGSVQQLSRPLDAAGRNRPAPAPRPAPSLSPPLKRIVVATQPERTPVPTTGQETVVQASPAPDPPVQPVLVEASPSPSGEIPEAYVLQPAYAAAAGTIE